MSRSKQRIDSDALDGLLMSLRLPDVRGQWRTVCDRSNREGWAAERLVMTLAELEAAGREQRRIDRHLKESHLLPGKTLDSFEFKVVPNVSRSQVMALATSHDWLGEAHNLLMFGPPGVGKSHLACGIGHALIGAGFRVLYARTGDLVQTLQRAKQDYGLKPAVAKLDKYHLLILDDFAYAARDGGETSVLFELIGHRYEHRSLAVTSNQPFSKWDGLFPDPAMTLAVADRLVHHSTAFEMNTESFRRRQAGGKPNPADGS